MKTQTLSSTDNINATEMLVLGGSGKTGRRVVQRLEAMGHTVRVGSRGGTPPFDWKDSANWAELLRGVAAVYIAYYPDLAVPGSAEAITRLVHLAEESGVGKLVLLSGRGEPEARACEEIVQASSVPSTIVRCAWFNQNFSEYIFREMVMAGQIALPAGEVREPFVDVDDIAEVAAAALTDSRHDGELYELTGPCLLTFDDVAAEISRVLGREVTYVNIPHADFMAGLRRAPVDPEVVGLVDYLFREVLDGRNARLVDGVQRALGRPAKDFAAFVRDAAAAGAWKA